MKIDALGETSRVGAGVAQLEAKIDALTASEALARNIDRGIIKLLSSTSRRLLIRVDLRPHVVVGATRLALGVNLHAGLMLLDDAVVV